MNMPAEKLTFEELEVAADLCTTCLYAGDCVYAVPGREPVLRCEFFATEGFVPPPAAAATEPEAIKVLSGLCGDCEHRDSCTMARPEGGVWQCEEYS